MTGTEISRLYRDVLLRAWPAALLFAILSSYFLARLMEQLPDPLAPDALERVIAFAGSAMLLRGVLVFSLLSLWPGCALVMCAHRIATRLTPQPLGGLLAALADYPAALAVSVVFTAVVEAASLLFLVPGIYLAGALQLWVVALLAGDAKGFRSLHASWRLVLGHWWRSNTMVAAVVVAGFGSGMAAGLIAGFLLHALSSAIPIAASLQRIVDLIPWVLGILVAAPAYPVALVASYRDLEAAGKAAPAAGSATG